LTFKNKKHERQILTDCQIYVMSETELCVCVQLVFGPYWATAAAAQRCLLSRNSLYNPSIIFQLLQIAFLGRCDPHCDAVNTREGTVSSLAAIPWTLLLCSEAERCKQKYWRVEMNFSS